MNVSRETLADLEEFERLVRQWNPKINLVSKSSLEDIRTRHIEDSLQLYELNDRAGKWLDLGSGGRSNQFHLVESDQRKCAFLRTAARELGLEAKIHGQRIEELEPQKADVVSARALADLPTLLELAHRHMKPGAIAYFPKGKKWGEEVAEARKSWQFDYEALDSKTSAEAAAKNHRCHQPEGWGGENNHLHQSGRCTYRSGAQSAVGRPRPAGQRLHRAGG
jgi:16S rRNA (guanine527-N7)-methyltransferase